LTSVAWGFGTDFAQPSNLHLHTRKVSFRKLHLWCRIS